MFVLSGSERQPDIDRCYAAGANAYLTKPGSLAELRALVRMLFRTMSTFKAPSHARARGPRAGWHGRGDRAGEVVDQGEIDAAREAYEASSARSATVSGPRGTCRIAAAPDRPRCQRW